jgi:hypothetical protein
MMGVTVGVIINGTLKHFYIFIKKKVKKLVAHKYISLIKEKNVLKVIFIIT